MGLRFPLTIPLNSHPSPDIPIWLISFQTLLFAIHSICVPIAKGQDWATAPSLQFLNPNNTENHKIFHNSLFGTTCPELSIGYL